MNFFFFDTETTGLIHNSLQPLHLQPKMIEFYGAIVNEKAKILEELQFMCNPGFPISHEITDITHITNEDLKGKKSIVNYLPSIQSILKKAQAIVGQNLIFDKQIVNFEGQRHNFNILWPVISICTVEETEWVNGYRLSLGKLHEWLFNKGFESAHRAKEDTQALIRCFFELRKRKLICLA